MEEPTKEPGEDLHNIVKTATDAVGNLLYTVAFDICNELITAGADQEAVLECGNRVVNRYIEGGVKVRKKPAPRAKAPKLTKDMPVDALTAASRKMNMSNLAGRVLWVHHPESNEFSYTTSVKLVSGYPLKNNLTQKVCAVVNEDSIGALTVSDAKLAMSLGLEIDYDEVVK